MMMETCSSHAEGLHIFIHLQLARLYFPPVVRLVLFRGSRLASMGIPSATSENHGARMPGEVWKGAIVCIRIPTAERPQLVRTLPAVLQLVMDKRCLNCAASVSVVSRTEQVTPRS